MHISLIPKDGIFQLVGLCRVVNYETFVILRALVHNLAKELKGRKSGAIVFVEAATIGQIGLTKDEHKIDVRAERRWNAERELHRDNEKGLDPATVHKQIANILIIGPRIIIHTVIQNQEGTGIQLAGNTPIRLLLDALHNQPLTLHKIRQNDGIVVAVDKHRRHNLFEKTVGLLCARDHRADGQVLVVEQKILNKGRFACATTPNKDARCILRNVLHVEFPEAKTHAPHCAATGSCHFYKGSKTIAPVLIRDITPSSLAACLGVCLTFHNLSPRDQKMIRRKLARVRPHAIDSNGLKGMVETILSDCCRNTPISDDDRVFFKHIDFLQRYHPGMDIFKMPDTVERKGMCLPTEWRVSRWLSTDPSESRLAYAELENTRTAEKKTNGVFVKSIHLLDPVGLLHNEYAIPEHPLIPQGEKALRNTLLKLHTQNNQAYVDAVANYVLGRLREMDLTPHCILSYGSMTGIAKSYSYRISDEFPSYRNQRWFWRGLQTQKGELELVQEDAMEPFDPVAWDTLRTQVLTCPFDSLEDMDNATETLDDADLGDLADVDDAKESSSLHSFQFDEDGMNEVVEGNASKETTSEEEISASKETTSEEGSSEEGSEETRSKEGSSREGSSEESDDEDDEDEDSEETGGSSLHINLKLPSMPIVMVFQEAQKGTMDDLFDEEVIDGIEQGTKEWDQMWLAWLFQVISALSFLQKTLCFTHNDLHTNNLVWRPTDKKFLYYAAGDGTTWRVPTYGRIFSLIDFGRAIFRIKDQLWISDDHWPGHDAGGQYNFGPFYEEEMERIPPNPSFDLCRLAISMLEGLYLEHPPKKKGHTAVLSREDGWTVHETTSRLFNLLWSWTVTDEGETLFEDEYGEEKYPGFELYMQIARECHSAVPREELRKPVFDSFKFNGKVPVSQKVYSTGF